MGRKQGRSTLAGAGGVAVDTHVQGPELAVRRIVERVLEAADSFLASQSLDPKDADQVRKAKSDVTDHKDQLFQLLVILSGENKVSGLAARLAVVLAGAILIAGRVGISETVRRQLEREVKHSWTIPARRTRLQNKQPYFDAVQAAVLAEYQPEDERSVLQKNRAVNNRLAARDFHATARVIKRHRDLLGLR